MMRSLLAVLSAFVLVLVEVSSPAAAATPEKRIAFVVGNESYAAGALPTAANDAGLVAQTLQAAGFEVVGARDLDAETLRQSYADFLKKLGDAGPDTVAFVYLAGYGLQYGNDNYYVPIGAAVARDTDIPIESVRLSDLMAPLIAMNLKARFMVFDAAYKTPFRIEGAPLAGGFSLVDASPGTLVAYNAAPGTIAPVAKGNYGLYAQSLAAMLREGGLAPDALFDRVRLRVNEESKGAEVPWDSAKVDAGFRFFVAKADAPASVATADQVSALLTKPLKDLPVKEAYVAAVARDDIASYQAFCTTYPADPLAKRARVLLAARREASTWRQTIVVDTPDGYWSYLRRYPRGPHANDARLRLRQLSVALAPPESFQVYAYDVPPPPPEEIVYVERPVIYFDDPGYDFPPPPPPPDYWLPPVPVAFLDLPPPPPPEELFVLPVPVFVPLPVYYDPPDYVAYPAGNYFYGGGRGGDLFINNTTVINNIHGGFPGGGPRAAEGAGGNGLRNAAIGAALVALPVAAAARVSMLRNRGITTPTQLNAARREPGGLGALRPSGAGTPTGNGLPAGQRLPGAGGRPLPAANAPGVIAPAARVNGVGRPGGTAPGANAPAATAARPSDPAAATRPAAATPANRAAARRDAIRQQRQDAAPRQNVARPQAVLPRAEPRAVQPRAVQPRAVQPRAVQPRAVQQRAVQPRAVQQRPAPQQRAAPPQRFEPRQAPPQIQRAAPPQFRPPPQQARPQPPQQQGRPGGFGGGGGGRPPGFGGGGGAPRPAPAGGGRPAPPQQRGPGPRF